MIGVKNAVPARRSVPFLARAGVAGAIVAACAIWVWKSQLEERFIVKRWGVVEPGLIFRSGQISPFLVRRVLEENQIQVVIDLTGDDPTNPGQPAERKAIADLGIELAKCPLWGDGTGDVAVYTRAITEIVKARRQRKPVLVHCYAGSQRTGGVVAAFRILVENSSPAAAIAEMKKYGWTPRKDRLLLDYLNSNMEQLAQGLVENGVIEKAPRPLPHLKP